MSWVLILALIAGGPATVTIPLHPTLTKEHCMEMGADIAAHSDHAFSFTCVPKGSRAEWPR